MAKLAKTSARLSTSITIRAIRGEVNVDSLTDADSIRALSESSVKIGAIMSFTESSPRDTQARYELDADVAGDIVERIPQLVNRSLRVNRAVLYAGDILQAFGFTDVADIIDQNVPFVVVKVERAPEGTGIPTRTTVYTGCWFHDLPKTYDMGGNLQVMQDLEIGYTRKSVV
jgi:hypothetical protein